MQNNNLLDKFKAKETALKLAISRVENKLQYAAAHADNPLKFWNNWHDLHDRLIDRLKENWSNWKDWHFENYGFNTYP